MLYLQLDVNGCICVCVCVHARVDVGTLVIVLELQTEQRQETSECVAIVWVSLHFYSTWLLQSGNFIHFSSLPH